MNAYTLPLTRWHKVAERLSRAYGELTQAAHRFLAETKVTGYLGERQVERLQAQGAEHLAALQRAFRLQEEQVGELMSVSNHHMRRSSLPRNRS